MMTPPVTLASVRLVATATTLCTIMILIVDDEPYMRLFLNKVLSRAGYTVAEAANGREAMRRYDELKPRGVITDLIMPEQEGIETIMELRRRTHVVPIIAMSGGIELRSAHYLQVAGKLGADAVLEKPFTAADVLALVARLVGPPETAPTAGAGI
jgi:two-component system chemotaxis response regulator CheY